jgi:hypothetical protein
MDLFVRMAREEWRSQTTRFGRTRFAVFPLFIALSAAGAYWFVTESGTPVPTIALGVFGLTFLFGLHTGTIAFIGRDALANLFGDRTLIIFSARTLPVARWRLLATFVVKDLLSYSILYIAPLVVALTPFWLDGGHPATRLPAVWLTAIGTFAMGAALTIAVVGAYTRQRLATLAGAAVLGAGLTTAHLQGLLDLVAFTPVGFYRAPSLVAALQGYLPIPLLFTLGGVLFQRESLDRRRTRTDRFRTIRDRLPGDDNGLVTWTLFDVARSSGSVFKVVFTLGIVYAVAAFLVGQLRTLIGVEATPGIAFGALLGLGSFGTYSWLTQFDGPETYLLYPLDVSAVVRAKFVAYLVLSIPSGALYLAIAAVTFGTGTMLEGAVVFVGVAVYTFGLTASLAGLAPNELLFDTPRFARYGAGMMLVAVPLLVGAIVHFVAPLAVSAGAVVLAVLAGAAGVALTRRAGPHWDRKVRDGSA